MFSEAELQNAINELEQTSLTYQDAEKLATFYIIYEHSFKRKKPEIQPIKEVTIDRYNGSEFYCAISGKKAKAVWRIMNEVMGVLKVSEPHIYKAFMQQIKKL